MKYATEAAAMRRDGAYLKQWALVGRLSPGGETSTTFLDALPFSVGRRPDASLTIARQTISGRHAEFFTRDGELYLRDLGSTNGTYVAGERISGETLLSDGTLLQFADMPFQLTCQVRLNESQTISSKDVCDHALALVQFQTLLEEKAVLPFFQPIIDLTSGETLAFEVLARSRVVGLETAGALFGTAAELGMEEELSRLMRLKGMEVSTRFADLPHLFLNTHPVEISGCTSFEWLAELRSRAPSQKLTLEIHEAAVTDIAAMTCLRSQLDDLSIGLAFDDFGAGQARIAELSDVQPEYLKFDRRIIKDIDTADKNRSRLVQHLVDAVRDIGIIALAEGIETRGECEACCELGFVLGQGFLLGRPQPVEHYTAHSLHASALASRGVPCDREFEDFGARRDGSGAQLALHG